MNRKAIISTLRANPRDARAWAQLGAALAEAGESEKAVECYLRALRIDGTLADAHKGLAALQQPASLTAAKAVGDERETRQWSPMTHILLSYGELSLDELRVAQADSAFANADQPSSALRLLCLFFVLIPWLSWAFLLAALTQTDLGDLLLEADLGARGLAVASMGLLLAIALGVATWAAQRLGWLGVAAAGLAWGVWLVTLGALLF